MTLQQTDVFGIMRSDLERVDRRVAQAADLDYPIASTVVADIVRAGGKRLRPLVLLLCGRSYDYDVDTLVTAAAGVELLHTASLIHDDTVDRAALRRGKPTLNSMMSAGAVILVGDYLFAQSAILAAATNSTRVVTVFASTLGDLCNGQLHEMFNAHRLDQSREQYEERIYGKSASLFAGAAEMGAIIGAAPEDHIASLRAYGSNLGMAFQIVDDVLDLTENTQDLGKPAGHDLRQGTVTLPTMFYASELPSTSADFQRLSAVVSGNGESHELVEDLVIAIRGSNAISASIDVAREYVDRAKRCADIVPDPETRGLLYEVADFALHRLS
ncbi:MAG: polyprenyl synthetase family protein [Thermomicrobiales bacterium]